ncbi:MAG: DegV family protein [Lachnospiraceae bacterium]|nr:DegV family protein [Lachnospiraceae bacterium]
MSKTAIVCDSNTAITQAQAKEMGIFVLPYPFHIEGETYYEDISLSTDQFYQKLNDKIDVATSQPSPESVTELWDQALKDHDELVYIPMSSGLSGSCSSAYGYSQEPKYEGKVYVIDNQRISVTQRQSVLDAMMLADKGKSAKEIHDILTEDKFNSSIYIMLDTLYYLKKGGRITPAVAALGTLLRLKPVLQIQGEKLDTYAKARTAKQGKEMMIDAVKRDIENRFGGLDNPGGVFLSIAHTHNLEAAMEFKAEVEALFPQFGEVHVDELSLVIACHLGPGALALTATKKLPYYGEP